MLFLGLSVVCAVTAIGYLWTAKADKDREAEEAVGALHAAHDIIAAKNARIGELQEAAGAASRERRALARQLDDAGTRLAELEASVGAIQALREEIAQLEREREPLRGADTETIGGKCTGSMEPYFTCLDTATLLRDFAPAEITVGTVIAFKNGACWPGEHGHTLHRVMQLRIDGDGQYSYLPRGDASPDDDGCWLSPSDIRGYVVDIQRGARPKNAFLRDAVLRARERYDETGTEWAGNVYNCVLEFARGAWYPPPPVPPSCFLPPAP